MMRIGISIALVAVLGLAAPLVAQPYQTCTCDVASGCPCHSNPCHYTDGPLFGGALVFPTNSTSSPLKAVIPYTCGPTTCQSTAYDLGQSTPGAMTIELWARLNLAAVFSQIDVCASPSNTGPDIGYVNGGLPLWSALPPCCFVRKHGCRNGALQNPCSSSQISTNYMFGFGSITGSPASLDLDSRLHFGTVNSAGVPTAVYSTVGLRSLAQWRWHHVAVVYSCCAGGTYSSVTFYIDGQPAGSYNSFLFSTVVNSGGLYINSYLPYSDFRSFPGELAELRIWKTARTQAQIQSYMRTPVDPSDPNLILYLPMNESPDTPITDHSNAHLAITGGPPRVTVPGPVGPGGEAADTTAITIPTMGPWYDETPLHGDRIKGNWTVSATFNAPVLHPEWLLFKWYVDCAGKTYEIGSGSTTFTITPGMVPSDCSDVYGAQDSSVYARASVGVFGQTIRSNDLPIPHINCPQWFDVPSQGNRVITDPPMNFSIGYVPNWSYQWTLNGQPLVDDGVNITGSQSTYLTISPRKIFELLSPSQPGSFVFAIIDVTLSTPYCSSSTDLGNAQFYVSSPSVSLSGGGPLCGLPSQTISVHAPDSPANASYTLHFNQCLPIAGSSCQSSIVVPAGVSTLHVAPSQTTQYSLTAAEDVHGAIYADPTPVRVTAGIGRSDFNCDDAIDATDFNLFKICATRAGVSYSTANLPAGCTMRQDETGHLMADYDGDGDIDMDDFAQFQRSQPCHATAGGSLITTVGIHDVTGELINGFDRGAIHSVDGSGLNVNGPDTHSDNPDGSMWLNTGEMPAAITWDLGSVQSVSEMKVWNYNESWGDPAIYTPRGVHTATLQISSDGVTYTTLGTISLAKAPGDSTTQFAQHVAINALGRYVRLANITNWGDPDNYVGLSEVQFFKASVPCN